MKSRLLFAAGVIAVVAVVIGIFAVSIEKREAVSSVQGSTADMATLFVETDTALGETGPNVSTDTSTLPGLAMPPVEYDTINVDYSRVHCAAVVNGKAIAGTEGGLLVYDPVDSSLELVSADKGLADHHVLSILSDGNSLYIGTKTGLFVRDEYGIITPFVPDLKAEITAIAKLGDSIYVGTAGSGLMRIAQGELSAISDKQSIVAIQFGGGMMWIASRGEGLFCYDGVEWKKRYLEGDSTAFDHISSLAFKFNRLYAGTPEGMYVFDGGRWDLYDGDNGLLVCDVTSISFMRWKVLAGTRDWGYYEIFEEWVTPISWSEGLEVTALASDDSLVVIGTPGSGIYVAVDKNVKNVNPGRSSIEVPLYASQLL
jgi:hypothetical protein